VQLIGAHGAGCLAASRLQRAGATRVAGSTAMCSPFFAFLLRLRFNKLFFKSTAFFQSLDHAVNILPTNEIEGQ
jgi:hypothetical protein